MARKPIVRLQESFKIFVDKFNVLSNNVGEPTELNTYNDSDLVTVINEIDATFDAYEGEILYPNPDVPFRTAGQLPNTHLKISTNQSGGTDIDIDAGQDFLVDAVRHINLTGVNFDGDYSGNHSIDIDGNRTSRVDGTSLDSVGGTITVTGNSTYTLTTGGSFTQNTTGNYTVDATGYADLDFDGLANLNVGGTYDLTTGGNFTQTTTGNIILDASGDITLDADGNDIYFKNGGGEDTVTHNLANNAHYTVTTPSHYTVDVNGDITFDAEGNDIIFKNGNGNDQVTHTLADGAGYTVTAPGHYTLDVVGNIILDADGNDIVLRNGAGGDSAQINLADDGNLTVTTPNNLTLDVANDIIIDAGGDNIRLKDGGTTRQEYTLGATTTIATTGNRTETVTGDVSDSAAGTYSIGATGNMDIDTRGTLVVNTGGNNVQYTTGHIDLNATQNIVLDAGGDIYLDAGDSDIYFQRNNTTYARWQMGIPGNSNALHLKSEQGDLIAVGTGQVIIDAHDSDIKFNRQGETFVKTQMGLNGDANLTRQYYQQGGLELDASGNITLDASGDIILDAAADDVILKDAGTEFLKFTHAGNGNAGIDNNGIRVITFSDSDATFENDVVVDRLLDVNAFTHKNGSFSPLSSGNDKYIGTLNTFNNGDGGGGRLIIHDGQAKTTRTVDIAVQNIGGTANIKYAVSGTGAGGDCDIQLKYVVRSGEVDKVDFFLVSSGGKSFTQYYYWLTSHLNVDDTAPTSSGATTIDLDDNIAILARQDGYVGIKKTNPSVELDIDGRIAAEAIDVDSADIANFNINTNTISNSTAGLIVDVAGDIVLDADGNDIKFKNGDGGDEVTHTLADDAGYTVTTPSHLHFDVGDDIILDAEGNHIIFRNGTGGDSAQIKMTDTGAFTLSTPLGLTFDAVADITLDAGGGDIFLKDDGNQYGCLRATIGNDLIIKSGTTTAMTFSGANVTMAGQITLPSEDLNTATKTVHGAINEVDSDLGERTSLSSFYDGHNQDIVTALNRVAARVVDIYDAQGNLLNS